MSSRIRKSFAFLTAAALLLSTAAPAFAEDDAAARRARDREVPVVMDALVLRPLGVGMVLVGGLFFGLASPMVALTRPNEFGKLYDVLLRGPIEYTFVDPLGQH